MINVCPTLCTPILMCALTYNVLILSCLLLCCYSFVNENEQVDKNNDLKGYFKTHTHIYVQSIWHVMIRLVNVYVARLDKKNTLQNNLGDFMDELF